MTRATHVQIDDDTLRLDLDDGRSIIVPLAWYPRLWYGSSAHRANVELVGGGAYLHWPDLDEDLTVMGLVAGKRSVESSRSLAAWLVGYHLA